MKFKAQHYPVLVNPACVPEMSRIEVDDGGVHFGASVTLTQLMETCKALAASLPRHQTSGLRAVAEQLRWFAGPPIRNASSIGGNICTASPISGGWVGWGYSPACF